MVGRVLKKFFWNTFDHLGACVVLNVLWALLSVPWLALAVAGVRVLTGAFGAPGLLAGIIAGLIALWLNPASLGMLAAASEWANYHTPDRDELWAMFRRRLFAGMGLSLAGFLLAMILGVNSAFYLRLGGNLRWAGLLLAGIMLWAQIALLSIVFHLGLALARDQEATVRQSIRQALFLALTLPLQSLALGGATLLLAVLLALTQIGIPLVAMSIPSVFAATGERELLKRFRPYEPGQEEADRLEEVRTFRDLFKPWDMR